MRAILFHNPTSGSKGFEKEDILAALKLANIDATYVSTKGDEVEAAFNKKADLFIAAGGDGTIRTVVAGARDRGIPVAILPLGTANNVARSLGIAGTPQELVETWNLEHTVPLDTGSARGAWGTSVFLEAFGVGLMPAYLRMAAKSKKPEGAANLQQGRDLLQKALKKADPIEIEITIDGKKLKGEFFGVEVLNVPFTGPGLPLGPRTNAADGKLDVICFEADSRKELLKWLDAPLEEPPPVTARKGSEVCLTWRDAPNRLDDKSFDNDDKTLTAEIACEEATVCVIMPRKLPAQKAHEQKAETA
jgi:diacylglycerol kinase family enzyme